DLRLWWQLAQRAESPRASLQTAPLSRSRFCSQRSDLLQLLTRHVNALRFAPKPFEVVKATRLVIKNVDDEIAIDHQHPFGILVTFNARGASAVTLQLVDNFVGDCLHLTLVRATGEHKEIREAGDLAQIKHR